VWTWLWVLVFAGSLFAADPFAGTWVLNLPKSKLAGPYAIFKSESLVIQEQSDRLLIVASVVSEDGSSRSFKEVVAKFGGELKYAEGGLPVGVSRIVKRIDDRTITLTTLRDGQEIQVDHDVVSKNGKGLRITRTGTGPDGKSFESVEVLDRK
jgi:hypothetical protein